MGVFDQQGQPRRSGIGGRLVIAIIIALVGWFMYMNQVQENPFTGEKQHVTLSPDEEVSLGLQSAPLMAQEMGGELPDSDPRVKEVQRMGNQIVKDAKASESPWKFHFHLLADADTVNAFALPGGQIFITLGLYNKLQTQAELAGVLSHEMGHVIERHTAEQMAKNQLGQFLIAAVGTGVSDSSSGSYNATVIASMVNQMFQLRYSRHDEAEADIWGIKLMSQAGYDPRAMIKVMQVLKEAGGGRGGMPEFFQTHPDPDHRMELIEAYLQKNPPRQNLSQGKKLKDIT